MACSHPAGECYTATLIWRMSAMESDISVISILALQTSICTNNRFNN
jgi:hypothetical protein